MKSLSILMSNLTALRAEYPGSSVLRFMGQCYAQDQTEWKCLRSHFFESLGRLRTGWHKIPGEGMIGLFDDEGIRPLD